MTDPAAMVAAVGPAGTEAGQEAGQANAEAQPLRTPAKIAVAQIGEVAPPAAMLDQLRNDKVTFASVQPVSGVIDTEPTISDRRADRPADYSTQQDAQRHAQRMRLYARDIGADYLFLFGGTVDKATTDSPLKLANATI